MEPTSLVFTASEAQSADFLDHVTPPRSFQFPAHPHHFRAHLEDQISELGYACYSSKIEGSDRLLFTCEYEGESE